MTRIITLPPLPTRPLDGHKGMFGRVLVLGGNEAMIGAPVLTGTAAMKMGAGLVQIATPRSILAAALSITPELIGLPLGTGPTRELVAAAMSADAVVVGPGLGTKADAKSRVLALIKIGKPMVIDADALNLLSAEKRWPARFKAQAILTPHPGEMKRLGKHLKVKGIPADDHGRIDVAIEAARTFKQIIVFKGHRTIVTDGNRVYVNRTGDSSLSKAGTGDVLSGMIATLLGQKMDRFDAACAATWIHGRAGEIAGQKLGRRSVLARDIIDALPAAIGAYESDAG